MHGHNARAIGSVGLNVGLRAGVGILGYFVAYEACTEREDIPDDYCPDRAPVGVYIGIMIGSFAATALDVGWLAYDEKEPSANMNTTRRTRGLDWSFSVAPVLDRGRIGVGFVGQF